jgi:hypothetical protein
VSACITGLTPSAHELRTLLVSLEEDLRNDLWMSGTQTGTCSARLSIFSALRALRLIPIKVITSANVSQQHTLQVEKALKCTSAQKNEGRMGLQLHGGCDKGHDLDGNLSCQHEHDCETGDIACIARQKQDQ